MPQLQLRRYEQILQNMTALVVARTALSDLSDTSAFKHLLAACARELDEAYYQLTLVRGTFSLDDAAGEDLDARAKEIQPATLSRITSRRAVGWVVFSRIATAGTVAIPKGTVVKTKDGRLFRTTLQGFIVDTLTVSDLVPVVAVDPGTMSNVSAGTVVQFAGRVPGVDYVHNPASITQGRDEESDDAFRARIKAFVAALARCPPQALEFAAVGVEDSTSGKVVVFSHLSEDPIDLGKSTLYIDDGAGTAFELAAAIVGESVTPVGGAVGGEEFLNLDFWPVDIDTSLFTITSSVRGTLTVGSDVFLNPATGRLFFDPPLDVGEQITASYTPFTGLISAVQKVVDGDPDDRLNYPGWRAAGTLVRVLSPTVESIQIEGVLTLQDESQRDAIVGAVTDAVISYVNTLGISGDVIRSELIQRIMEVRGVIDVDLLIPTTNVTILDDQIPRTDGSLVDFD